jgi:putative salt-induced outer membrane protein
LRLFLSICAETKRIGDEQRFAQASAILSRPMMLLLILAAPVLLGKADPVAALPVPPPDTPDAATPAPIPPQVKAMIDAAIASNNDGDIVTVAKYARAAAPEAKQAIDAEVAAWKAQQEAGKRARVEDAGVFGLWQGKAELGGYLTTGNTRDAGFSAAVALTRESVRWRHKINLATDYKESAGLISREHYLAAYEPNFKFSSRAYVYGATQFESDRFLGYYDRYSASLGAGYSALSGGPLKLDLELGPAYRKTDFTDDTKENSFAARGSVDFAWKLSSTIALTQVASAYVQKINSTVSSTTAVNAKLIGPLAAQLSYAVQYESTPPIGRVGTDTTSRASLVYSF